MQPRKKIRLGDLLVEQKIISEAQLETALKEQKKSGRKLGRTLMDLGFIDETQLVELLSRQLQIPYVDLKHFNYRTEIVRLLPEMPARRHRAIVLDDREGELLVGVADPTDIFAFDQVTRLLGRPVALAVVKETDLLSTLDHVYRRTDEISSLAEAVGDELRERDIDLGLEAETEEADQAPVVKLLQSVLEDALQIQASDIHIEPDESVLRIRHRVDGALQEQVMDEKRVARALVLKLKLMAGLDISERRLPQDGRFSIKAKGRTVDVRMSTMPVQHGESVVLRLFDTATAVRRLSDLGMEDRLSRRFTRLISQPHGMVLVTGPTGSGKTTTLYSALELLNQPENKLITVEDPVEYQLQRVNQVQVHGDIGLTFARVLRSILRQDPDVVLVGEMRDEETVEIGLRAAVTGHMVLSTLHTNDSVSTLSRLMDMGAKGYLLASAIKGVLAQRLIRRICEGCGEDVAPEPEALAWLHGLVGEPEMAAMNFRRGSGCSHCNGTGYRGRTGVYELLEMDRDMIAALGRGDVVAFSEIAREQVRRETLGHAALRLAGRGVTTIEEVMRVTGDVVGAGVSSPPSADAAEIPLPLSAMKG